MYEGMWVNNMQNGIGTMRWVDKNQIYIGGWENNEQVQGLLQLIRICKIIKVENYLGWNSRTALVFTQNSRFTICFEEYLLR